MRNSMKNSIYHRCYWPKKEHLPMTIEPIKLLCLEILIQALKDLIKGNFYERRNARIWFEAEDPTVQNSFNTICRFLKANPDVIRKGILINPQDSNAIKKLIASLEKYNKQCNLTSKYPDEQRYKRNRKKRLNDIPLNIKPISNPEFIVKEERNKIYV